MASYKTIKPSGLTITRNGDWFTLAWKIADNDYDGGQTVTYNAEIITAKTETKSGKKTTKYTTSTASGSYFVGNESYKGKRSLGAKTTELSVKVDATKFYPSTSTRYLSKVIFKIQAKRAKFKKEDVEYVPTVSDWVTKEWTCNIPYDVKSLTNTLTEYNRSRFSWEINSDEKMSQWFKQWEYESILLKNSTITDGSKVNFTPDNKNRTYHIALTTGSSLEYDRYITEDSTDSGWATTNTYTRWMRIRTKGPRGNSSKWKYAKHIYAKPKSPTNVTGTASVGGTTTSIHLQWKLDVIANRPVDYVIVQYLMAVPTGAGMGAPDEGWTDSPAGQIINTQTYDGVNFTIDSVPDKDECIWARVAAVHDSYTTWTPPVRLYTKALNDPSDFSVTINQSTHRAVVSAQNNSANPGSQMIVRYFDSISYPKGIDIGRLYHNESSVTIQCPNWEDHNIYFQIYAIAATSDQITTSTLKGNSSVTVFSVKPNAKSAMVSSGGTIPIIPQNVALALTDTPGTVKVTWKWSSLSYEYLEISWSNHEDAWTSTDPPQTTVLDRIEAPSWYVTGLDVNSTYYFRLRFGNVANDGETTWGGYSETQSIELAVAPPAPVLYLSESVSSLTGKVKAYWTYYAEDGTTQKYADIYYYNRDNLPGHEYVLVQRVKSVESFTFTPEMIISNSGENLEFAITVTSSAGKTSDYSDLVSLFIADPLKAEIIEDSFLHDEQIEIEDGVYRTATVLSEMPIRLKLKQPGPSESWDDYVEQQWTNAFVEVSTSISRAEDYYLNRPDESEFIGYEGELVALLTQSDTSEVVIDTEDLLGFLDDGAKYRLTVTVKDAYGQTDSTDVDFEVHWAHQAIKPLGTVIYNDEYEVAFITPIAPEGAVDTDVCDIYRLSTDKPELIYAGATFGQRHVDPYPTLGDNGGYRFVFRTVNNDYITPENEIAWFDVDLPIEDLYQHIDFGNDSARLLYNVDLSSSWSKDFKEQKYLGGSVQGDWNPAVSRTGTINGVVVTATDQQAIEQMRRLAEYPGICRIRTRDGSNYSANVNVSESRGHELTDLVTSFSLNVTRVEPEELSALTFSEWAEFFEDVTRTVSLTLNFTTVISGEVMYVFTTDHYVVEGKTYYDNPIIVNNKIYCSPVENVDPTSDPALKGWWEQRTINRVEFIKSVQIDLFYRVGSTSNEYFADLLNANVTVKTGDSGYQSTITYDMSIDIDGVEIYSGENMEGDIPISYTASWDREVEAETKVMTLTANMYADGTRVRYGTTKEYINIPPLENGEPVEVGFNGTDDLFDGNVIVRRNTSAINFRDTGDGHVIIYYE